METAKEQLRKIIREEVSIIRKGKIGEELQKDVEPMSDKIGGKKVDREKLKGIIEEVFLANEDVVKKITEAPLTGKAKEEDYSEAGRSGTPTSLQETDKIEMSASPGNEESEKEKLEEVTPPGREKQVKALKKELPQTYVDPETGERKESSPWAVSWASYKKSHE